MLPLPPPSKFPPDPSCNQTPVSGLSPASSLPPWHWVGTGRGLDPPFVSPVQGRILLSSPSSPLCVHGGIHLDVSVAAQDVGLGLALLVEVACSPRYMCAWSVLVCVAWHGGRSRVGFIPFGGCVCVLGVSPY